MATCTVKSAQERERGGHWTRDGHVALSAAVDVYFALLRNFVHNLALFFHSFFRAHKNRVLCVCVCAIDASVCLSFVLFSWPKQVLWPLLLLLPSPYICIYLYLFIYYTLYPLNKLFKMGLNCLVSRFMHILSKQTLGSQRSYIHS